MPTPYRTYRCGDRTCGALDCTSCFPDSAAAYVEAQRREAEEETAQALADLELREHQSVALNDSIEHWRRLANDTAKPGEAIGMSHCALCQEFIHEGCQNCPVFLHTGKTNCAATPYATAEDEYIAGRNHEPSRFSYPPFLAAAKKELEFLLKVKEDAGL